MMLLGGAGKDFKSIDDILKDATHGRVTKGKAIQFEKSGGYKQAFDDFNNMDLQDAKDIPGGKSRETTRRDEYKYKDEEF